MEGYTPPKKIKKIGDLFARYKDKFKPPQGTVEKACVESIFEITGIKLDKNNVSYTVNTKTIKLNISSLLKTEIKFKQREIIANLKQRLGGQSTPEIIL